MAFDAAERNGRCGRIHCQRGKESSSSSEKRKRRTVGVEIKGKVIQASFLKIEGRGTFVGTIDRREGRIEKLVGGQNPGPEAPPRGKKRQERREQRKCQGRSDCQRSDGEGWLCQGY